MDKRVGYGHSRRILGVSRIVFWEVRDSAIHNPGYTVRDVKDVREI